VTRVCVYKPGIGRNSYGWSGPVSALYTIAIGVGGIVAVAWVFNPYDYITGSGRGLARRRLEVIGQMLCLFFPTFVVGIGLVVDYI
jgi:hypothetical protein